MEKQVKKMIAPILIVFVITAYYAGIALAIAKIRLSPLITASVLLLSLGISGLLIAVLVQRIREIRKGEEDDLGKY